MDQIRPGGRGQSLYDDISELYRLRVEVAEQRQRIEYLQSVVMALMKDGNGPSFPDFDGPSTWTSPTAPPRIFA
jgi:hypothetical protein